MSLSALTSCVVLVAIRLCVVTVLRRFPPACRFSPHLTRKNLPTPVCNNLSFAFLSHLQIVRDSSDLMRLIYQGNAVRRVAATKMNDQSSRSHSVFTIRVEQKTVTELEGGLTRELTIKAKINLGKYMSEVC